MRGPNSISAEQRHETLRKIAGQRWKDVDATAEFFEYYVTERGHHPRSIGGFTMTSGPAQINFGELRHLEGIAPRPILLITGENARSRYYSDTVFEQAPGPRELLVVPGARHIDFYDRVEVIPFDAIERFYRASPIKS